MYLSEYLLLQQKLQTRLIRPCPWNKNHFFFFKSQMKNIYLKCKMFTKVIFILHNLVISFKKISGAQLKLLLQTADPKFNCCWRKLTDTNFCSIPGCQQDTRNNARLLALKYILETAWTLHSGNMKVLSLIIENVEPAGRRWGRVRDWLTLAIISSASRDGDARHPESCEPAKRFKFKGLSGPFCT